MDAINSGCLQQSLDSIIKQVDENRDYLSDEKGVQEFVELIHQLTEKSFIDSPIINDYFFVILRDCYLNLLQRERTGEKLNEISSILLETISNFFLKMSSSLSNLNLSILKQILYHPTVCDEINRFLEEFSLGQRHLEDYSMKILDHFFRTIQRLERISSPDENPEFFSHIVRCICSPIFFEIFLQSIYEENLHWKEQFLLHTCIDYISSHCFDQQHQQSLIEIRQILLHSFTQWMNEHSLTFRSWNNRFVMIIRQISFLLTLPIQSNRNAILDNEIFNDYRQLIDSCVHILYSIALPSDHSMENKHFHQILIGTLISNLSTMILSNQLVKYFQTKHVHSLMIKFTSFPNDQIQFNTLKILSAITMEQQTKDLVYANHLIKVFIEYLNKFSDDQNQTLQFLKNFIQYDQIQEEFIKEDGISLIVHSMTDEKFQSIQLQQSALEILLALAFHKPAQIRLKEIMNQIESSLILSHQGISNTFQDILWKLDNDQQISDDEDQMDQRNFQYDVFVSFAPPDRQFALRIFDQLIPKNLRVWIDADDGFARTMLDKCQIIDSCEYFLLCISDSYKHSLYSRCEATYAYEHHHPLIPLIVTSKYRADGWLNRLINGKCSIDLTKIDYEMASKKLKDEIDRPRKYVPTIPMKNFIEYSSALDQWTNDDIQSFLKANNLHSLLPLFSQMNGHLLHQLYRMCLANRESMFHTLKNELSTSDPSNQPLTLLTYLRFLCEIEKCIPSFVMDSKKENRF